MANVGVTYHMRMAFIMFFVISKLYFAAQKFADSEDARNESAQNIADRLYKEVVEILVNTGKVHRDFAENSLSQGVALLRENFARLGDQCASDYLAPSVSFEAGPDLALLDVVRQKLDDWAKMPSIESSQ